MRSRNLSSAVVPPTLTLVVDGRQVEVPDHGSSLLEVLRDRLGVRSVKDGCSPQGQCGCCTVLVDGAPRVACVTPARRVGGRAITTVDGLADADGWAEAFTAAGASQCGFCTPGIIVRLSAFAATGRGPDDLDAVERALLAHLCRCTGWRTILDAWRAHTCFENEIGPSGALTAHKVVVRTPRGADRRGRRPGGGGPRGGARRAP